MQFLKAAQHTDKHQAKHPGWLSPTENPTRSAAMEHFRNLALVVNPNENHENLTLKAVNFKWDSFSRSEHKINTILRAQAMKSAA